MGGGGGVACFFDFSCVWVGGVFFLGGGVYVSSFFFVLFPSL